MILHFLSHLALAIQKWIWIWVFCSHEFLVIGLPTVYPIAFIHKSSGNSALYVESICPPSTLTSWRSGYVFVAAVADYIGFTSAKQAFSRKESFIPIGSMYGIFTYIWLIFMVNVGKYTIHGSYGILSSNLFCVWHVTFMLSITGLGHHPREFSCPVSFRRCNVLLPHQRSRAPLHRRWFSVSGRVPLMQTTWSTKAKRYQRHGLKNKYPLGMVKFQGLLSTSGV